MASFAPMQELPPRSADGMSGFVAQGRRLGANLANLYQQTVGQKKSDASADVEMARFVSAEEISNPREALAKELASASDMEAFLKTNAVEKIKSLFEGKEKNLLHITAQYGSKESLEVVLKHVSEMEESQRDAILNAKTSESTHAMTPLNLAAWLPDRTEVVELLAHTSGVDLNEKNRLGMTPLMSAAYWKNTGAFKALLTMGEVDVNAKYQGLTPLMSVESNAELFREVLSTPGVDVNAKDRSGRTVLGRAAADGNAKNMAAILERDDIDVHQNDNEGCTPLNRIVANAGRASEAIKEGGQNCGAYAKTFDLLAKDSRIDVNRPDEKGRTPVSMAAIKGRIDFLDKMLANPAFDFDKAGANGITPFMLAVTGEQKVVDWFLQHGDGRIDFNARDAHGMTALTHADAKDCDESAGKLMKDKRVDLYAPALPNDFSYVQFALALCKGSRKGEPGYDNVRAAVEKLANNDHVAGEDRATMKQWLEA